MTSPGLPNRTILQAPIFDQSETSELISLPSDSFITIRFQPVAGSGPTASVYHAAILVPEGR